MLGATGTLCAEEIIHTTHLAAALKVYFATAFLSGAPISVVIPMLPVSPVTSTAPAVFQLVTYGKTALINFISKLFTQNGIYYFGWFQLEFVHTFQCKMRLEVNILTCWWSATWRCTGYKGHSIYTPVTYCLSSEMWLQVKARQVCFERKLCSWFWKLKEMLEPEGRIFMMALPEQSKTDSVSQEKMFSNSLCFWGIYSTGHLSSGTRSIPPPAWYI